VGGKTRRASAPAERTQPSVSTAGPFLATAENVYARVVTSTKAKSSPVQSRRPRADVWAAALRLAGGDPRRFDVMQDVMQDGSVVVRNYLLR
jgi:hypothetical protein